MKRKIINIDESKCDGCGICVPNCHEGALQIIDGKARLVSGLFCDGLGACIGHCPQGAITIELRDSAPYDEKKVMERIATQGVNTIMAHLEHLRDHGETELLKQAVDYIREHNIDMVKANEQMEADAVSSGKPYRAIRGASGDCSGGCPGSAAMDFSAIIDNGGQDTRSSAKEQSSDGHEQKESSDHNPAFRSALSHWPVQMHLINPAAGYYKNRDVVLAADCVAFAMGNFHHHFLRGRSLAIACPKLDTNKDVYVDKLVRLIDHANINTFTVVMMEVPCCSGLIQLVKAAQQKARGKIPVKQVIVSIQGELMKEEWNL
ncbi:MAG: 4Fe-4S binding protein [Bacteroidales bacterium]